MACRPAGLSKAIVSRKNEGNELLGGSQSPEAKDEIVRIDRYLQVEEKHTAALETPLKAGFQPAYICLGAPAWDCSSILPPYRLIPPRICF